MFPIELPNKHVMHSTVLFSVIALPFHGFDLFLFSQVLLCVVLHQRYTSLNKGISALKCIFIISFADNDGDSVDGIDDDDNNDVHGADGDDHQRHGHDGHLTNKSSCFPPSSLPPWWAPSKCR